MRIFTKSILKTIWIIVAIIFMANYANAQQQIPFEGYLSQGQGFASWNANGSGPEPAATGHINPLTGTPSTYYAASLDYITQNSEDAGFHLLPEMTGFPDFELSLISNGYTPEDVTIKLGLGSYEEDIEGLDWLTLGEDYYANHYDIEVNFELDGQAMLIGNLCYINHQRTGTENYWYLNSPFTNLTDVSVGGVVAEIAAAFLNDMDGKELIFYAEMDVAQTISGNGRSGYSFNLLNGMLTAGNPTLPFQGLNADHEGFAGWDADGTGLEPYGNGHLTQLYYGASLDYDNIDPDPSACLGHFLEGSKGFFNTELQLQYRGFEIGDLKMKLGLESLGPDVQGEDWGYQNGYHWCNYYNNGGIIELNGEPILVMMQDTNKLLSMSSYWTSGTGIGKVYDISQNASPEAQFVAQSFLNDLGTHYIKTITSNIQYHSSFNGYGRDGALYELEEAALMGVHQKATFIPEGPVSGIWTAENSPYLIDGHLSIENGQTLTIESGVEVKVRGPYHFDVQGTILAEGSADENILFTRSNPVFWWDGIDFNNTPAENDTSKIDHCIFEYGYAQGTIIKFNCGGAIAILNFDKIGIYNSVFRHNKADIPGNYPPSGGAIAFEQSDLTIQKCEFYDNSSEYGGAIFVYNQTNPVISNNLFYQNTSNNGGAICYWENCGGILINSTFADNQANYGGALYFYDHSNPQVIGNILWGNEAAVGGNQVYSSLLNSSPGFYYCDIEEGQAGFEGYTINGDYLFNIQEDPLFSGDEVFPYSLLDATSPCWNAGTPDTSAWYYPQYLPETCLCGADRIADGCVDIGAYETILGTGITHPINDVTDGFQVYPNPVKNSLTIEYQLQEPGMVRIDLLDLYGRQLANIGNTWQQATNYRISFNASDLSTGIYFCRMQIGNETITRKIIKVQ